MELKKVNVGNKGMSQDYSISKDSQEYAFKNRNIRIQALEDNTLLSVTNIKGPKKLTNNHIQGRVLGKCFANKYLILFTLNNNLDCIYRIEFKEDSTIDCKTLYCGTELHFEPDRTFDTLFYYENLNVQKVYWVESWYSEEELVSHPNSVNNPPRYINIITEGERNGGNSFTPYTKNDFDFYPNIDSTPEFNIIKDYSIQSELPSGIILYFITYYFENGAETLIANNSSIFTIDYSNRGAKADEVGCCGFKLTVSNIDTKFDYFRIYSATRTSKDGPIILRIVSDTKINKDDTIKTVYTIEDNGVNLETLDSSQLFYIGGNPFYAKTIEQKDDTLFVGNIKTQKVVIPLTIQNIIDSRKIYFYKNSNIKLPIKKLYKDDSWVYYTTLSCYLSLNDSYPPGKSKNDYNQNNDFNSLKELFYPECVVDLSNYNINPETFESIDFIECTDIVFDYKGFTQHPSNLFSSFYNYRLQTINSDKNYKTFKNGEMYRFGIQFQTKQGLWTYVIWLGDKECHLAPKSDKTLNQLFLSTAKYSIPEELTQECLSCGYSNYRIVIADPENLNGRRVLALGVVCPTLFSPGQRAIGSSHSISSWIMRPRGFKTSYNHFEPIGSTFSEGAEIFGYDVGYIGKTLDKKGAYITAEGYREDKTAYSSPFYKFTTENNDTNPFVTKVVALSVSAGKKAHLKISTVKSENPFDKINWEETTSYSIEGKNFEYNESGSSGWSDLYKKIYNAFEDNGLDGNTVPNPNTLQRMANNALDNLKAKSVYELLHPMIDSYYLEIKSEITSKGFRLLMLYKNLPYGFSDDLFTSVYINLPGGYRDYMQVITGSFITNSLKSEIENEMNNFYVDESIITFHSPDIPVGSNINAKFRVVGLAPIDSLYTDLEIQTSTLPYIKYGGTILDDVVNTRTIGNTIENGLYSGYLYADGWINLNYIGDTDTTNNTSYPAITLNKANYKMYLWDKLLSIPGVTDDIKTYNGKELLEFPSILKSKTFFNLLHSFGNIYIKDPVSYNNSTVSIFNETSKDSIALTTDNRVLLYNGNYDYLITRNDGMVLYDYNNSSTDDIGYDYAINATVRIKYNSSSHVVLDLLGGTRNYKKLLPKLNSEIGFDYNKTNKNKDTHQWGYADSLYINVGCCWTSKEDIYKDNSWFTALLFHSAYSKSDVKSKFLEYFNSLNGNNFILAQHKSGTGLPIYVGVILDYTKQNDNITDYLIESLFGESNNTNYFISLYEIKINSDSIDNLSVDNLSIQGLNKRDSVFIYEDDYSYGRFLWINSTSANSGDGKIVPYKRFPIKYEQPIIDNNNIESFPNSSYLFIGELYHDIKPKLLYGGYDNISNLLWYPVSTATSILENTNKTSGDTYYLRWDCLKTFPKTEEDVNKVVDITSFMVETRKNLDARTDPNRGNYNIMSRPSNFNLFNPVYDFKNNLFLYNINDSNLSTTEFENQFTWTLKKNFAGKIDSWTNAGLWSISQCDSPITKLVNYNNQIFSLNENSVEVINYNNKNLITSEDSTAIELANSNIVDGTTKLFSVYGTHNNSVLITEKGLYFIDDNEKSLIRISSDGSILKAGIGKMDSWFKNNINLYSYTANTRNKFHLEYDSIHKDIYIIGNDDCLIYNEALDAFTSFVDYKGVYTIINNKSNLYAIHLTSVALSTVPNYFDVYKMFDGEYNIDFNGQFLPYTVLYRINPDPYNDKVFTNIEFIADYGSPGLKVFDTIKVWNEYLDTGEVPLEFKRNYSSNLKLKFRIWRADIPRDANSKWKRDRIRNPWIHLKLTKNPTDTNKMEFHSMNVQYML